jgi:hypothetical protein
LTGREHVVDLAHFGPLDVDSPVGGDQNHPLGTEARTAVKLQRSISARAASTTSRSVATAMPVASASSRRLGFSRSAPR